MKKILIFLTLVIPFLGCESYLDKELESTGMTEEQVFTDYLKFRKFEDRMYKDMHDYLSAGDYSYIAAMCDEGYLGPGWETMPMVQSGDWIRAHANAGAAQQFQVVWRSWESIRIANLSLEHLPQLENATDQQIRELKGQAHFMRAWYYYELLRRWGGMPYLTRALQGDDNFALARLSYHETALMIAADCDTAASLLPEEWESENHGRPEKGAAMALKATALLYSASPTNNPDNDQAKWELAAQASWDFLSTYGPSDFTGNDRYRLVECTGMDTVDYMIPNGSDTVVNRIPFVSGFDSIFMYQVMHDEIIWENWFTAGGGGKYTVYTVPTISGGGVIQGFTPSANIVDHFETKNGLAIGDDAAFSDQNPYVDRDPRFYHSIIFNRERWTSQTDRYMELFEGGAERQAKEKYAFSGYMARKYWAKNVDQWSGTGAPYTHTIYLRLADIILQYAEAANEIGGPDYAISGAGFTAVQAVDYVRARVGMPGVDSRYLGSKEDFRVRIKNERAVELFLEGKRFFDLSRWGDAHKSEHWQLYADNFEEDAAAPTGYNISRSSSPFATYTFRQKHYRWPIPLADALMFYEFNQNPGW